MNLENKNNREKNIICMSEKQAAWCIFISIVFLCILMLSSYMLGYRCAMRYVIQNTQKDSFADQIYSSLTAETLMSNNNETDQYYLQCTTKDPNDIQSILHIAKNNGITFWQTMPNKLKHTNNNNEEVYHYMVSSIIKNYEIANAIGQLIQTNIPSLNYDIISIKKNTDIERPFS